MGGGGFPEIPECSRLEAGNGHGSVVNFSSILSTIFTSQVEVLPSHG